MLEIELNTIKTAFQIKRQIYYLYITYIYVYMCLYICYITYIYVLYIKNTNNEFIEYSVLNCIKSNFLYVEFNQILTLHMKMRFKKNFVFFLDTFEHRTLYIATLLLACFKLKYVQFFKA